MCDVVPVSVSVCVSVCRIVCLLCDVMVLVEMARAHVCVSRALYDNIVIVRNDQTCVKKRSFVVVVFRLFVCFLGVGVGIWH